MNSEMSFNPRYPTPSDDVLRMLRQSRMEADQIETRDMKCPICGFRVRTIPVSQTDIVFVKCQKCKFDGPLNPAYFRRTKRNGSWIRPQKRSHQTR